MALVGEPPKPRSLPKMVGWYDPVRLLETARLTILAKLFAERADFRLHERGRGGEQSFDYRDELDPDGALWIDYVADLGDGFDSTFSIARLLAAPSLAVRDLDGKQLTLPRGRLLLLGGDQVYPTPSDEAYLRRLVDPYEMALPGPADPANRPRGDSPPLLFAIPGNHDWYDGLQSYVKVFCRRAHIGGWSTPQSRSYFALRLPHGYWLFGLDTQLHGDLDETQLGYFCSQEMTAGERVVMCVPEPHWVQQNAFSCSSRLPNNIVRLLDNLRGRGVEVPLHLGGDLHHYRRHSLPGDAAAAADPTPAAPRPGFHLVTSGGGGAFLHPTHTRPRAASCQYHGERSLRRLRCKLTLCRLSDRRAECLGVRFGRPQPDPPSPLPAPLYPLRAEYPPARQSWAGCFNNLVFLVRNPRFGLATAVLYLMLAWLMPAPRMDLWARSDGPGQAFVAVVLAGLSDLVLAPARLLVFVLVLFGFWTFTDTHRQLYRLVGGLLHGGAHLTAALFVAIAAQGLGSGVGGGAVGKRLCEWAGIAVGGYVAGAVIMGVYLVISCALFGRHGNEAFSALRIQDHKHLLRMRLDRTGLQVWAVALSRVSRFGPGRDGPALRQAGSAPVVIDRFAASAAAPQARRPAGG